MLFTIIGNLVALGAVAALVSAVVKKDRASRDTATPAGGQEGPDHQKTTAGRGA